MLLLLFFIIVKYLNLLAMMTLLYLHSIMQRQRPHRKVATSAKLDVLVLYVCSKHSVANLFVSNYFIEAAVVSSS